MTFTGATPCVIGECLVLESDVGNTGLFSSDWDLFEQRTSDGLPVRFNPPLRVYQWPLRVGSSWSYMATIETSQGAKIPTRVTGDCCFVRVSDGTRSGTFMAFRTILSLNGRQFLEGWWAPETRTGVRTIMTDPSRGQIIGELIDYQRSAYPAGAF